MWKGVYSFYDFMILCKISVFETFEFLWLVRLKYSLNCDWFIWLSVYRVSDYKLSDYKIGSQWLENTWSFKPITFEKSIIFMIRMDLGSSTKSFYFQWAIKDWTNFTIAHAKTRTKDTRCWPSIRVFRTVGYGVQLETARSLKPDLSAKCPQSQDFIQNT